MPEQQNELQSIFFNSQDKYVLSNLLGAYYIDQEKGWTLLNRGVVIGSIHFNIEELIRGLSNINCEDLIQKKVRLEREKKKYEQMSSTAQYQE